MKKILIIEDDPLVIRIYRQKYEAAGYSVASAEDGEKGLQKVKEFRPDLVQVDLMLPKMSGVAVIREIRSQPEFKTMPILVLSNTYATDLIGEAEQAGANKSVSKARSTPNLMLEEVSELLNGPGPSQTGPVQSGSAAPLSPGGPALTASSAETSHEIPTPLKVAWNTTQPAIRQEFFKRAPSLQADLRSRLRLFAGRHDEKSQQSRLQELCRSVHSLAGYAGMAGFMRISHITNVLEVLLKEIHNKPTQFTPSILRTIAAAVECLVLLLSEAHSLQDSFPQTPLILAVDDEPISRIIIRTALDKAGLSAVILDDSALALKVLAQNRFDLIFLDVNTPGMDGFELCGKIRASVTNKMTPVVFVTALSDFENRTRSTLIGGNDLIAKPFLQSELAVKALTLIVKQMLVPKTVMPPLASQVGDKAL